MNKLSLFLLMIAVGGCTDVTPQVSLLKKPAPSILASPESFVHGDIAAATTVQTSGGEYSGTILVHAGNRTQTAETSGGSYKLTIKKISY